MENLRTLHLPKEFPAIYKAKREMKILELLPFCLRMVKRRENQRLRGHERQIDLGTVMKIRAALPFQLGPHIIDEYAAVARIQDQYHFAIDPTDRTE